MAHLKAIETRNNRLERKQWKLALTRRLYEQNYEREDIINLFSFIDWVMSLPLELEQEFLQEVLNFEESRRMPYITSVERIATLKGIQQGIRQGLLEGIKLGLELKFGSLGLSLSPSIERIEDVEQLREIATRLKTVTTVEELRLLIQPTPPNATAE